MLLEQLSAVHTIILCMMSLASTNDFLFCSPVAFDGTAGTMMFYPSGGDPGGGGGETGGTPAGGQRHYLLAQRLQSSGRARSCCSGQRDTRACEKVWFSALRCQNSLFLSEKRHRSLWLSVLAMRKGHVDSCKAMGFTSPELRTLPLYQS